MTKKEMNELLNFMDEFAWLSAKYKPNDIKKFRNILSEQLEERNLFVHSSKRFDNNTSKNYLIGVLPKFFQDKELFEKNNDLVEFAECIGIYIRNAEKKSRYEIIGNIICNISEMNEYHLSSFVKAINALVTDEDLMHDLRVYKNNIGSAYNWNDLIRRLSEV